MQEENVLIRKSVKHCQIELTRPGSARPALCEDQEQSDNVIELSKFRGENYQPLALGNNDVLLQGSLPTDTSESVRDPFIQRYKQTQQAAVYFKNQTSFEISI
jgi:hypothetical protein